MRKTYYTLNIGIQTGWTLPSSARIEQDGKVIRGRLGNVAADTKRWGTIPVHAAFANVSRDAASVLAFTRKYGVIKTMTLPAVMLPKPGDEFLLVVDTFYRLQLELRDAWRRRDAIGVWPDTRNTEHFDLPITRSTKGLELRSAELLMFMRFLLDRDIRADLARICAYKKCPLPFFIAGRKNQKFCRNRSFKNLCGNAEMQDRHRRRQQ